MKTNSDSPPNGVTESSKIPTSKGPKEIRNHETIIVGWKNGKVVYCRTFDDHNDRADMQTAFGLVSSECDEYVMTCELDHIIKNEPIRQTKNTKYCEDSEFAVRPKALTIDQLNGMDTASIENEKKRKELEEDIDRYVENVNSILKTHWHDMLKKGSKNVHTCNFNNTEAFNAVQEFFLKNGITIIYYKLHSEFTFQLAKN